MIFMLSSILDGVTDFGMTECPLATVYTSG